MKKLNKLQINSERLMKNEELISVKGGYDGGDCWMLHVTCPPPANSFSGLGCGPDMHYVYNTCVQMWEPTCFCTIDL